MIPQKDWSKKGRQEIDGFFCAYAAGIYGGRKFTIYGARSLHQLGIAVSLSLSQTTTNKKKRPANKQPKQDKTPALFLCLLYSSVGGRPTLSGRTPALQKPRRHRGRAPDGGGDQWPVHAGRGEKGGIRP